MADLTGSQKHQPKTIEAIVDVAKRAFDPSAEAESRRSALAEYDELIEKTETWTLLPRLNTLIKPNVLPEWLREPLMQTLTRLPLRPDGVRGTLEFVFSVHPSNTANSSNAAAPQKDGASITHQAIAVATKLLSSVPSHMTPRVWFEGLSGQMFTLMDGNAGPDLAKTAAQIVGFGILGKKQLGAPGAPGWNAFVQPLLESINPSLKKSHAQLPDGIIDLSQIQMLVTSKSLQESLSRLQTLILSNPSPGLCKRLLKPILVQLWVIASWINPPQETESRFCIASRNLIHTYLRLFGNVDNVEFILRNLMCRGSSDGERALWIYRLTASDIDIVALRNLGPDSEGDLNWVEINSKATALVEIIAFACSTKEVSSVFLNLLKRWVQAVSKKSDLTTEISDLEQPSFSPIRELNEVTVLQKLLDKAPDKLVNQYSQLLDLICQVLRADTKSPLDNNLIAIVLSLFNLIITAASFQKSDIDPSKLQFLEKALSRIGGERRDDISATARNLSMLLKYRDEINDPNDTTSAPTGRQIEDRQTYNLAISYITGEADNPPPVVAEGLKLLSTLILASSPVLDITAVGVLMSNLLKNNEDYINLQVIKLFTQLASKHPKSTVQELLDHYLDTGEKASTDERLRFGEALVQVVERLGQTCTGDVAQQLGETLLSIAGRRGYRPKTMAKQRREEKLREMKNNKQGGDADAEDSNNILDDTDIAEEDQAGNDILAQITQGWESKRGSEDVRMRASALSIFGTAVEVSISGLGPTLVSTGVDLSINILAMEPDLEKAILRRSAILMILGFVKALDQAREEGRVLGFGLTGDSRADIQRTLEYIAATDNDGLVRQHAEDVIDSLRTWEASSLLSRPDQANTRGLTQLAGLRVNPGSGLSDGAGSPRPRIEEIE